MPHCSWACHIRSLPSECWLYLLTCVALCRLCPAFLRLTVLNCLLPLKKLPLHHIACTHALVFFPSQLLPPLLAFSLSFTDSTRFDLLPEEVYISQHDDQALSDLLKMALRSIAAVPKRAEDFQINDLRWKKVQAILWKPLWYSWSMS